MAYISCPAPCFPTCQTEVPQSLRHLIATDESELPDPICHDIYSGRPQPEPIYTYQATGGMRGGSQQIVSWQAGDDAAEFANTPLPVETQEALTAAHEKRSSLAKAQMRNTTKTLPTTRT